MENESSTYFIPDNFIDEPRIFMGTVKRKNFIQGLILAVIPVLLALALPIKTVQIRIVTVILIGAAPLLVGIVGFNGDSIFAAIKLAYTYRKEKSLRKYNPAVRVLEYSAVADMMSQEQVRDKIIAKAEELKASREARILNEDADLDTAFELDPAIDNYTGRKRTDGKKNSSEIRIKPQRQKTKIVINTKADLSDSGGLYDTDEQNTYRGFESAQWSTETADFGDYEDYEDYGKQ